MAFVGTNAAVVWCYGTMRGGNAINRQSGVSSLTDEGVGKFRADFSTQSTSNYAMVGSASNDNGEANFLNVRNTGTRNTSSLSMEVYNWAGGRVDSEFGFALFH